MTAIPILYWRERPLTPPGARRRRSSSSARWTRTSGRTAAACSTPTRSKEHFARAVARLEARLRESSFLLGDRLSRVDITAAALLAPVFAPPEHPCRQWAEVALPGWHAWASRAAA